MAVIYAVFAGLWIFGSDQVMHHLVSAERLEEWSLAKGLFFVILSATLLFLLLKRTFHALIQAQIQRLEGEHLIQNAFASLGEAVFLINPSNRTILRCNPAAEKLFGYRRKEMIGQSTEMLFNSREDFNEFGALSEPVLRRGKTFQIIFRMRRKDGSRMVTANTVNTIDSQKGWEAGVISVVRDISEQQRTQDSLLRIKKNLEQAQAIAHLGSWELTPATGQLFWSDEVFRIFGLSPSEFAASFESFFERVHPDDRERFAEAQKQALAGTKPLDIQHRIVRPDGTVRWVHEIGELQQGAAGTPERLTGTVLDITDRKYAEEQLHQSQRRLRALTSKIEQLREEERTRISREIHDELGQSLTGLKMDLRWCERKLAGKPDRALLNAVSDRLMTATQLTDETIAAVQKIAAELRPGALDKLGLHAALRGEAGRFEERSGIACRLNLTDGSDPASPEVATALFRIFQESLTNVLRHANATEVEVSLRKEEPHVYLRIQDNGRGISPEVLNSEKSLGLLGMSERIGSLGGRLSIRGEPGKGTVVDAQAPLHPTSSAEGNS